MRRDLKYVFILGTPVFIVENKFTCMYKYIFSKCAYIVDIPPTHTIFTLVTSLNCLSALR
jgi:hypothetical protein